VRGIDVHAHFLPAAWLERVAAGEWPEVASVGEDDVARAGQERVRLTKAFTDLASAIDGLQLRLLSIPPPLMAYEAPPQAAAEYCAAFNDALVAAADASERALALATLPMQDGEAAANELKRARSLGCVGAQIGAHVRGHGLGDAEVRPVLRAAAETGSLLLVHPYGQPDDVQLRRLHLQQLVAWPLQTTVAAVGLIFAGVVAELDRLKMVLAHGGGTLPYLLGRLDRGYEVHADIGEVVPEPPSMSAARFYYDSVVFEPEALRFLVRSVGASRVLLGSDYPFPTSLPDPLAALDEAGLGSDEIALITEENARSLLELSR
jgi:aminocarboxymuconate-semialdehyde decarboxylase